MGDLGEETEDSRREFTLWSLHLNDPAWVAGAQTHMGESLGLLDKDLGDDTFFIFLGEGEETSCFTFDSVTFIVTC